MLAPKNAPQVRRAIANFVWCFIPQTFSDRVLEGEMSRLQLIDWLASLVRVPGHRPSWRTVMLRSIVLFPYWIVRFTDVLPDQVIPSAGAIAIIRRHRRSIKRDLVLGVTAALYRKVAKTSDVEPESQTLVTFADCHGTTAPKAFDEWLQQHFGIEITRAQLEHMVREMGDTPASTAANDAIEASLEDEAFRFAELVLKNRNKIRRRVTGPPPVQQFRVRGVLESKKRRTVKLTDPPDENPFDDAAKSFTWGGQRFTDLQPRTLSFLKVLYHAWRKGDGPVTKDQVRQRVDASIDSGTISQIFKINRNDRPKNELHPASVLVERVGRGYQLIDPEKVPDKVPKGS